MIKDSDKVWTEKAEVSQGLLYYQSDLVKTNQMPMLDHLGNVIPTPSVKALRGAEKFYHFLLKNKENFEERMILDSPTNMAKNDIRKTLRTMPFLGIGRHAW